MPKRVSEEEYDAVVEAVSASSAAVSADDIARLLENAPARRTLQRRLASLVAQGRLLSSGDGWARRYFAPLSNAGARHPGAGQRALTYSEEAEAVRGLVSAPIPHRTPVGYNRSFLDSYRPNESFYLDADTRAHLRSLGCVPGNELPPGTYLRQVFHRLLIDLSWNSSRLEGNTYSLLETERLLDLGESAEGKDVRETQMILNHKAAIELLVDASADIGMNRFTVCNLHAILAENLLADQQACGRVRSKPVGVTGTVFHPLGGPQLIDECFDQVIHTAAAIEDIFEQAFFVMVHLPYLQPFEDVNKRVSRLAANIPLVRANVCPLSFVDVPERDYTQGILGVYELTRVELLRDVFVWAYERSCARYSAVCQSLGDPDPFRLHYRQALHEVVAAVVRGGLDKKAAGVYIQSYAGEHVPGDDQSRFSELAETELIALHEGSIARYRLRPSEYRTWHAAWR